MYFQEMSTVVQHERPINLAFCSNRYMRRGRQWRELVCDGRRSYSYAAGVPHLPLSLLPLGAMRHSSMQRTHWAMRCTRDLAAVVRPGLKYTPSRKRIDSQLILARIGRREIPLCKSQWYVSHCRTTGAPVGECAYDANRGGAGGIRDSITCP